LEKGSGGGNCKASWRSYDEGKREKFGKGVKGRGDKQKGGTRKRERKYPLTKTEKKERGTGQTSDGPRPEEGAGNGKKTPP